MKTLRMLSRFIGSHYLIVSAILLIANLGVFIFHHHYDTWDGSIIAYGALENEISGVINMYLECSKLSSAVVLAIPYLLGQLPFIDFYISFKIVALAGIFWLNFEIGKFLIQLKCSTNTLIVLAVATATLPFTALLACSIFIPTLVSIASGFRLLRKAAEQNYAITGVFLLKNLIFIIALLIMDTWIAVFPCLLFTVSVMALGVKESLLKSAKIFAALIALFILDKALFPPYGLYDGYNQVDLKSTISPNLWKFISPIVMRTQAAIWIGAMILGACLLQRQRKTAFWFAIGSCATLAASIIPYAIAGKTSILNANAFNQRHTSLLEITSIFLLLLIWSLLDQRRTKLKMVFFAIMISLIGVHASQQKSIKERLTVKEMKVRSIVKELKTMTIPSGYVGVTYSGDIPIPRAGLYEMNYILYRAYGERKWSSFLPRYRTTEALVPLESTPVYRKKYIMGDLPKNPVTTLLFIDTQKDATGKYHSSIKMTSDNVEETPDQ